MPVVSVSVTVRTTSDRPGHPHTVVAGCGGTIQGALTDLKSEAARAAGKIAEPFHAADHHGQPDTIWHFEVIGVQLLPAPLASGDGLWVAYGTLTSAGQAPWPSRDRDANPVRP